jgi:hypothetical protein
MFRYKTIAEQLREERTKNEQLRANQSRAEADLAYLAMMCEVELESTTDMSEEDTDANEV